jgi:hypothetical protein
MAKLSLRWPLIVRLRPAVAVHRPTSSIQKQQLAQVLVVVTVDCGCGLWLWLWLWLWLVML